MQRNGRPFRHVRFDCIEQLAGKFYRAWYHPTKGKRFQRISEKEALLTMLRKAQAKNKTRSALELPEAHAAAA